MKKSSAFADLVRRKQERWATGATKRVALLLRVSDKKQTKDDQDVPIPVQRDYCLKLLQAHGQEWEPATREVDGHTQTIEYTEAGVSAFKLSKDDRELLTQAMLDAAADLFDILVIYKSDRLSRNSEEYPIIIRQFANMGVEIWVYESGQPLKSSSQVDKLLRYVEGWQAETESVNTRIRTTNAMRRMAENGVWTGGKTSYGYRLKDFQLEERGDGRAKRRPVRGIEVNPEEARWVRLMFELYVNQGLGGGQVARIINNPPYSARKRTGSPWDGPQIIEVIKNPIYMGRPAWAKNSYQTGRRVRKPREEWVWSTVYNPEWDIVGEEMWRKAQEMRSQRFGEVTHGQRKMPPRSFTSHLLLTGLAYCGHCGQPLVTKTYSNRRSLKDGTTIHDRYEGYMCRHHKRNARSLCKGKRGYWRKTHVEDAVLDIVNEWFGQFDFEQIKAAVLQSFRDNSEQAEAGLKALEEEVAGLQARRRYYTEQLNLSIAGKSTRIPQTVIEEQLTEIETQLTESQRQLNELERRQGVKMVEEETLNRLAEILPNWVEAFKQAAPHKQKFLISQVIDRVTVYDDSMEVAVNVNIKAVLETAAGVESETAVALEGSLEAQASSVHYRKLRGPADL